MKTQHIITLFTIMVLYSTAWSQSLYWAKQFGGMGDCYPNDILHDSEGNVYITGTYYGPIDFDPYDGVVERTTPVVGEFFESRAYVQKLDQHGNLLWLHTLSGEESRGSALALHPSGGVVAAGRFDSTLDIDAEDGIVDLTSDESGNDAFFIHFDSEGNTLSSHKLSNTFAISTIADIDLDSEGNMYITGHATVRIIVAKLNSDGSEAFQYIFMGAGGQNRGKGIHFHEEGEITVTGRFAGSVDFDPSDEAFFLEGSGSKVFFLRLDEDGNFIWAKQIDPATGNVFADASAADDEGNIYTVGSFSYSCDFDPNEGVEYISAFGTPHVFVLKLDINGNYVWATSLESTESISLNDISTDDNYVYMIGGYQGEIEGETGIMLNATGEDAFSYRLNKEGNEISLGSISGNESTVGRALTVDNGGTVFSTGYFSGTTDFDPNETTANLTSISGRDGFIQKINEPLSLKEDGYGTFQIYPNPFSESLSISFENVDNNETYIITLYEPNGRIVSQQTISAPFGTIDVSSLKAGMYFMQIIDSRGHEHTEPVVKY